MSPARRKVPAPEAAPATSPALDTLTSPSAPSGVVMVPLERIHPHPRNPRRDLGDLTELADSIRSQGVRQNLLLTPDPDHDGEYRTVIGHRRAAAAALAGLVEVPAAIDPSLTPEQELELMLVENLQRTDLSAIEEADGYQGLLDLGVTVQVIATRTGRSQKTVRDRIKIAGLPEPAREAVHTHQVTLDDALALVEFDGPQDLRDELTSKLGEPGFKHAVERAKQAATSRVERARVTAELEAAGVRVITRPDWEDRTTKPLRQLTDAEPQPSTIYPAITPEEHASCPGNVAWIDYDGSAEYGCEGWRKNGHRDRYSASGGAEPTPEERRATVASNKAASAAQVVRRAWIRDDLTSRGTLPEDAPVYVARLIRPATAGYWKETETFRELLPKTVVLPNNPRGAMRILVALAAARVEAVMGKDFWRGSNEDQATHLEQLAAWGYELADVEREFVERMRAQRDKPAAAADAGEQPAGEPEDSMAGCTCLPADEETGEVPDHVSEQCTPDCVVCNGPFDDEDEEG